ncbi:hypothetical protein ZHAS_00018099 [Anopheles sinensis]|uniref:Uncharacterized protein n=1 Tax=Anopheles sinensis TaxID=74873 RepID=A0A084WIK7_ANOSI|nr:hypothetical protein ZHAS_00018099 [Anopheles sinensis]
MKRPPMECDARWEIPSQDKGGKLRVIMFGNEITFYDATSDWLERGKPSIVRRAPSMETNLLLGGNSTRR